VPVISEIEFASRHTSAKIIGITGSNGKTTTTKLTYHLLQTAGLSVGMGGNVGRSFARNITEQSREIYVLELSSFQLDGIIDFRPDVAILLNITPDHLDRYEYKMENYIRSKFRIAMNQGTSDLFIYNGDNPNIQAYLENHKVDSQELTVGGQPQLNNGFLKVGDSNFDMSQFSLKGSHNYFNATCAILVAQQLGVSEDLIQKGLDTFQSVPHRMELVATIGGVDYINDSKATNVDSVFYALSAMEKPIIWIAGGTDKGNDYEPILKVVEEKVKALICLGVDNKKLIETFSPIVKIIEETGSAEEAVERASVYAEKGDVVLLSPACASFDLFKNYENRGDLFREAVERLRLLKG
jgi:UDP-N-acetylmuramoylalanine--D-glutamate ligase